MPRNAALAIRHTFDRCSNLSVPPRDRHESGFVRAKIFFFFSVRHYSHDFDACRALQVVGRVRVRERRVRFFSEGNVAGGATLFHLGGDIIR
jgi:hypothetical protein